MAVLTDGGAYSKQFRALQSTFPAKKNRVPQIAKTRLAIGPQLHHIWCVRNRTTERLERPSRPGMTTIERPVNDRRGRRPGAGEAPRTLHLMGRRITLPRSRLLRIALGGGLVLLGTLGFLPILGFWMIPLGLLVLSYEFAPIRRLRRRFSLWWGRRGSRG